MFTFFAGNDEEEYFDDWNYENEDLLYEDNEMMPLKPKKSKTKSPTKKPKNNKKLVKKESKNVELLDQKIPDEDELDTKEYQCYR